jgi:hypothetical protein
MDAPGRAEFFKEVGAISALDKIIKTGYKALCLEYFFTYVPENVYIEITHSIGVKFKSRQR